MDTKLICYLLATTIGFIYSCSGTKDPNYLDSRSMSRLDRVKILSEEIICYSEILDAEFEMFNVNGFSNSRTTLPGASSANYKVALKIKPEDIANWTTGMTGFIPPETYDDTWTQSITSVRKDQWKTTSDPKFYTRDIENVILIVYEDEGFVFKHIIMN